MVSNTYNADLAKVLETALELVTKDRANQHGDAYHQHSSIADFWTIYLVNKGLMEPDRAIEAHDVAQMMVLMKISRAMLGGFNVDNFIDQCGYSALTYAILNRIPS